jgi:hypothetical protein
MTNREPDREISDDDLMADAADPAQARRLHKALRTLADNPSVQGPLKDMAREVLSGRISMREAIQSDRYLGALGDRMAEIKRAADELTPAQREAQREQAERYFKAQEEEEAREEAERDAPRHVVSRRPKHSG